MVPFFWRTLTNTWSFLLYCSLGHFYDHIWTISKILYTHRTFDITLWFLHLRLNLFTKSHLELQFCHPSIFSPSTSPLLDYYPVLPPEIKLLQSIISVTLRPQISASSSFSFCSNGYADLQLWVSLANCCLYFYFLMTDGLVKSLQRGRSLLPLATSLFSS